MWHYNFIEDVEEDMGIQPWSLPGSTQTGVPRPYTGIAVKQDGTPFLVRCETVGWIQDAKQHLDPLARAAGGHLIAALPGYREERILATWEPDFNEGERNGTQEGTQDHPHMSRTTWTLGLKEEGLGAICRCN